HAENQRNPGRLKYAPRAVAVCDMTEFVGDDGRDLIDIVCGFEQPPQNIDVTAGQRIGIGLVAANYGGLDRGRKSRAIGDPADQLVEGGLARSLVRTVATFERTPVGVRVERRAEPDV